MREGAWILKYRACVAKLAQRKFINKYKGTKGKGGGRGFRKYTYIYIIHYTRFVWWRNNQSDLGSQSRECAAVGHARLRADTLEAVL